MHKAGDFIFALHLTESESVPYFPDMLQLLYADRSDKRNSNQGQNLVIIK